MTPEERFERMELQMEFLAQNQAELTANVGTLKQDLLALARIAQQHVVSTEARFQTVAERFQTVAEQFQMVADQFQRVDESMESLAKAQRSTEERLNALITVVEHYFSNGKH